MIPIMFLSIIITHIYDKHMKFEVSLHFWQIWPTVRPGPPNNDSNNVFIKKSRHLVIFNYLLYTVHKIDFEGRFLDKIHKAGPVCLVAAV